MGNKTEGLDLDAIRHDIARLKQFIREIERIGGNMPDLTKAVNRLEIAINTGQDIGDAAEHTSQVLSEYVDDLHRACGDDWACKARVDRQWQARNVKWTLSWDNEDSTIRQTVRRTIQRYMPDRICERLSWCR